MKALFFLFASVLFPCSLSASPIPRYRITDVGSAEFGARVVINNKTQVAGTFITNLPNNMPDEKAYHAFLWQYGRRQDLGTLGKFPDSTVSGINDNGQIVGTLDNTTDGAIMVFDDHAFLWQHGRMRDLGAPPGDEISEAYGINSRGQIVGYAYKSGFPRPDDPENDRRYAFVFRNSKMQILGVGEAHAINDKGQIAGSSDNRAVLWSGAQQIDIGIDGDANAINIKGQVIAGSGPYRIGLWQDGKTRALDILPAYSETQAEAINDAGVVVGFALPPKSDDYHAIVWRNNQVYDLNKLLPLRSGWTLQQASGINDKGQIVGSGLYHGQSHAFLLTPIK